MTRAVVEGWHNPPVDRVPAGDEGRCRAHAGPRHEQSCAYRASAGLPEAGDLAPP
jgi:hypothetical protein